jgi:hypothetical protein
MRQGFTLIVLTMLATVFPLLAQPKADTLWTRVYGSSGNDTPWGIAAFSDGYVMAGTLNFGTADMAGYTLKLDLKGDTVWSHTLPACMFSSLRKTKDSGLILAGWLNTQGPDSDEAILLRMNAQGDTLWSHTYGGPHLDRGKDAIELPDGGFLLIGYTESASANQNRDGFAIRTDAKGDTVWTKFIGGSWEDSFSRMVETPIGDYLLWGTTGPNFKTPSSPWLVRIYQNGNLVWTRSYNLPGQASITAVVPANDSGFFAVATIDKKKSVESQMLMVKFNGDGDTLWTKTLGGDGNGGLKAGDLLMASDGYAVNATLFPAAPQAVSCMDLISLNFSGDSLWSRQYGERAMALRLAYTSDQRYLLAGIQANGAHGKTDNYIIKTRSKYKTLVLPFNR